MIENKEELKEIMKIALDELYKKNKDVIDKAIHENALNHMLAIYLEKVIRDKGIWENIYSIDVEYNKNSYDPKRLVIGKGFRPDIILHERRTNENNLLLIEAKIGHLKDKDKKILEESLKEPFRYKFTIGLEYRKPRKKDKFICYIRTKENPDEMVLFEIIK